ncbi:chemotaxis protein CheD [Natronospirillum operosum]|uniref:Probable chemoreceptor glutamine deamidase CheD n=1 Tax=Natronospirillum operosum TaxID=2759953 RepID=A0A4Z0WD35_9GAMM|nr:chemotaxis protein CheD [Natronospirillum operosum]TGG95784.1 chemotaxis protein CheD [Natronospirillum operosum]
MTTVSHSGIDIFLHPGEWYFGDRHTRIQTTLGSCVAVTLWHSKLKLGGMCHYMLPGKEQPGATLNARYGHDALQLLMAEIGRQGTHPSNYEAKLFGGASMFETGPGGSSVARRNIMAAEELVQHHGLSVLARSLGGSGYRQLVFDIATGDVWLRQGEGRTEEVQAGSVSGDVA